MDKVNSKFNFISESEFDPALYCNQLTVITENGRQMIELKKVVNKNCNPFNYLPVAFLITLFGLLQ